MSKSKTVGHLYYNKTKWTCYTPTSQILPNIQMSNTDSMTSQLFTSFLFIFTVKNLPYNLSGCKSFFLPYTSYFWFKIFQWRILTSALSKKRRWVTTAKLGYTSFKTPFPVTFLIYFQSFQYNGSHVSVHKLVLTRRDADLKLYVTSRVEW